MEAEPEQYVDEFQILSLLGEGGQAAVYKGQRGQKKCALKVYGPGASREIAYRKEAEILSNVEHDNLIKMYEHRPAARFRVENRPQERRPVLMLELAEGGDLFEYLSKTGKFSPELARVFIRQLITAEKFLDSRKIAHRDLKPENILFDSDFTLKISDFGMARDARGDHGDYELRSRVGTSGYRAPELEVERPRYEGLEVDMFAIGVVLFVMYTGTPPFLSTTAQDRIYARIRACNYAQFWQMHERNKPPGFYPDSFKRLINSFLSADPERRPSFQTLATDEWINGPTPPPADFIAQMTARAVRLGLSLQPPNIQEICNREGFRSSVRLDDESITKEEVFAYHYLNTPVKKEGLPQHDYDNVAYVKGDPKMLVSWLHYYLLTQREANNVFLRDFAEDIKFVDYQLEVKEGVVSLGLRFEVGGDEQTDLKLQGQLHRSSRNEIGIKWEKVVGNSYWLSEVITQISQSVLLIH